MVIATPPTQRVLSEKEIERAASLATATLAVAGHQASDFSLDLAARGLRGEITDSEAIELIAQDSAEYRQ